MFTNKFTQTRNILNRFGVAAVVLVSIGIFMLVPGGVGAQGDDIIRDTADAAAFCRTLPNGTANPGVGYCAFTMSGKTPQCTVGSNGSAPTFTENCVTYSLTEMVGESKVSIAKDVEDGVGGVSTTPVPAGDLYKMLQLVINLLSAVAGLAFVVSFIFAGFQYMTARDNAGQVAAAKERILTIVITFILFVFGYGLLQWLVPGGIF